MRILLVILVVTAAVASTGTAQMFSAEVSPNPMPQGQSIKIRLEATVTAETLTGCGYVAVHKDKPAGPVVYQPLICPSIRVVVGPGAPYTARWNAQVGGKPIGPGTYYVETRWRPINTGSFMPHFTPFRVDPAVTNDPVLSSTSAAKRGANLGLKLFSPNQPKAAYIMAASFTTNTGLTLSPTQHLALDVDFVFWLSLATPHGPIFTNFLGSLDAFGNATAGVNIPNIPVLQGAQLAIQAVVADTVGTTLSNPITRIIG